MLSWKAASVGSLHVVETLQPGPLIANKNMICLINLKLYYSRVKVYIACSHGDKTIAPLLRVEMGLVSQ